jgi:hypothetical protein
MDSKCIHDHTEFRTLYGKGAIEAWSTKAMVITFSSFRFSMQKACKGWMEDTQRRM